jgi:hypothetical protein
VSKRVPASATTRKRLEELMEGRTVSTDARSEFAGAGNRTHVSVAAPLPGSTTYRRRQLRV